MLAFWRIQRLRRFCDKGGRDSDIAADRLQIRQRHTFSGRELPLRRLLILSSPLEDPGNLLFAISAFWHRVSTSKARERRASAMTDLRSGNDANDLVGRL